MSMLRALVIGHSHANIFRVPARSGRADVDIIQLQGERYRALARSGAAGRQILFWHLRQLARRRVADRQCVVLSIGGNEHAVLGLVQHPRPFDFVLNEAPDLPLAPDAEIIPEDFVLSALRDQVEFASQLTRSICRDYGVPVLALEPPPPIASAEFISANAHSYRDKVEEHGISPKWMRYKLWRLRSALLRSVCEDCGIVFVPAPEAAKDEDGFLTERAWHGDPTHANGWYGNIVVIQLSRILQNIAVK